MPYTATVYKVLISSPSDANYITQKVEKLIYEENYSYERMNIIFIPITWNKNVIPEMGIRPQASINRQLVNKCDIMVAIFRESLGSPTGFAESGTLEEISICVETYKWCQVYFPLKCNETVFSKLQEYKNTIFTERQGLIYQYENSKKLIEIIRRHLLLQAQRISEQVNDPDNYEKLARIGQEKFRMFLNEKKTPPPKSNSKLYLKDVNSGLKDYKEILASKASRNYLIGMDSVIRTTDINSNMPITTASSTAQMTANALDNLIYIPYDEKGYIAEAIWKNHPKNVVEPSPSCRPYGDEDE